MVTITRTVRKLRGRIAETGAKHHEVAALVGIHPTQFSNILNERRPMPEGFEGEGEGSTRLAGCGGKGRRQPH